MRVRHGNRAFLGIDAERRAGRLADPDLAGGGAMIDEGVHATDPRFVDGEQAFHGQGPVRFLDAIADGADPVLPIDEAWRSLAMVDAAYRSAAQGRHVTIPHTLDDTTG